MGATLHTAGMNRFHYIKKNLWFTGVLQQDSAEGGGDYKELYNTQGRRGEAAAGDFAADSRKSEENICRLSHV